MPDSPRADVVIYSRALGRDEPIRLEAEDAAMPAPTDHWLYYVSRTSEILRKNTHTGKTVEIADPEVQPTFLTASGNTVAWVGDDFTTHVYTGMQRTARIANSAWVDHTEDGEIARVRPSWIEVGPNAVGFVDGHETGGTYLFDLTTDCLYNLGDAPYQASNPNRRQHHPPGRHLTRTPISPAAAGISQPSAIGEDSDPAGPGRSRRHDHKTVEIWSSSPAGRPRLWRLPS